ncbi:hypothetical protein EYF80_061354 [Liparis tanakae]|uniref:Uncharacterized protein n=1 Tax=Liparis tanakae TaxID=230148 RepID=A0A4Z2EI77_9TELE|nr:hypothetical protein EYF80_061354 [Liparis tanakae]
MARERGSVFSGSSDARHPGFSASHSAPSAEENHLCEGNGPKGEEAQSPCSGG